MPILLCLSDDNQLVPWMPSEGDLLADNAPREVLVRASWVDDDWGRAEFGLVGQCRGVRWRWRRGWMGVGWYRQGPLNLSL